MQAMKLKESKKFTYLAVFLCFLFAVIYYKKVNLGDDEHELTNHATIQDKDHFGAPDISPVSHHERQNRGIVEYSDVILGQINDVVSRRAAANDTLLVNLVRDVIEAPANDGLLRIVHTIHVTPQLKEVISVLSSKTKGFFIECGALDGERSSNTLYLEQKLGWSGILIEMDAFFYTQLLGKNRKAYSLNACLSPHDYVSVMTYKTNGGGSGRVQTGSIRDKTKHTAKTPCFPLKTILLALNVSHVDYFSLDVEGLELDILKTVPFDDVTVDAWSVEYDHVKEGKEAVRRFMEERGYLTHKDIVHSNINLSLYVKDFIFIRKNLKVE